MVAHGYYNRYYMRYSMALLNLSPLVSVKLKYAWQKPNSSLLYFKRRVPVDIKPLLLAGSKYAGKVHYVVSLQTSDPTETWGAMPRSCRLSGVRTDSCRPSRPAGNRFGSSGTPRPCPETVG